MGAGGGGAAVVPGRRLADAVLDWCVLGPALQVGGLGVAVFAGVRAVGWATGSGPATAQLLSGLLWRKGVQGTVLALLARRAVAGSGQRRRRISAEEHAWAERTVFGGTLPPRERVVLTDTIGLQGRAFTFPEPGGTITVNLGPAGLAEPLAQPALLLHELTHVWQIEHARVQAAWLLRAIGTQALDAVSHAAYRVPPGRPFHRLNPEQQATLVERWFVGGCDQADPDFAAIRRHIRGAGA